MAQSELPDDRSLHARGRRFHLEQAAHDRAPSADQREPILPPQRDPYLDRPVMRPVAADAAGERVPHVEPPHTGPAAPAAVRAGPPTDDGPREIVRRVVQDDADPERELVRRVFDDRTGDEWRVFERDARRIPGSRGARCLFFDGEGIVRRVWHYPADWQSLPATALLALMDRPPLGDR